MSRGPDKKIEDMSVEELRTELNRLRDNLCDLEDMHAFTFGKTSVHIGAEAAAHMQQKHDEECKHHENLIAKIEMLLKARGEHP